MKRILKNWKTSLFGGVPMLVEGIIKVVGKDYETGLAQIAAAIAFFLAKDHNVSGS